jgi:ATP:corrinoid adenosyltransferase
MKKVSVLGYALGLLGLGLTVYVVGYAFKKGTEKGEQKKASELAGE